MKVTALDRESPRAVLEDVLRAIASNPARSLVLAWADHDGDFRCEGTGSTVDQLAATDALKLFIWKNRLGVVVREP